MYRKFLVRRTLDNQVRPQDGHPANTDTSFGGSIGSSETGEDDSRGASQCTEKGLVSGLVSYVGDRSRVWVGVRVLRQERPSFGAWAWDRDDGI